MLKVPVKQLVIGFDLTTVEVGNNDFATLREKASVRPRDLPSLTSVGSQKLLRPSPLFCFTPRLGKRRRNGPLVFLYLLGYSPGWREGESQLAELTAATNC